MYPYLQQLGGDKVLVGGRQNEAEGGLLLPGQPFLSLSAQPPVRKRNRGIARLLAPLFTTKTKQETILRPTTRLLQLFQLTHHTSILFYTIHHGVRYSGGLENILFSAKVQQIVPGYWHQAGIVRPHWIRG